jgi:hypothetical protein
MPLVARVTLELHHRLTLQVLALSERQGRRVTVSDFVTSAIAEKLAREAAER